VEGVGNSEREYVIFDIFQLRTDGQKGLRIEEQFGGAVV